MQKIILIDGDFYLRRQCSVIFKQQMNSDEEYIKALAGSFFIALNSTITQTSSTRTILCWDYPPYIRETGLTEYKKDRRGSSPEERIQDIMSNHELSDYDKDIEIAQIQQEVRFEDIRWEVRQRILESGKINIIIKGMEADDLAFLLSRYYSHKGNKVVICSSDSDWLYMIKKNVYRFNPIKKELTILEDMPSEYQSLITKYKESDVKSIYELWNGSHNGVKIKLNRRKKTIRQYLEDGIKGKEPVVTKYLKYLSPLYTLDTFCDSIGGINNKIKEQVIMNDLLIGDDFRDVIEGRVNETLSIAN